MPSVEERIVKIDFDNSSFERKVSSTISSLEDLNKALKFEGAGKGIAEFASALDHVNFNNIFAGVDNINTRLASLSDVDKSLTFDGAQRGLNDISTAADNVDLSGIAQGVDEISARFSALGAVAFSVINSITESALGFGKQIASEVLGPITGGGLKRALNLEQAKFLFSGIEGLDVTKAMDSARKAVLGTAFGLDEAANAAAQFAASGVDAGDQMFKTLRGVAGVAAMTNTSFSEMADVFTQAAGQGKISGFTLQRISQRGLNVAAALAKQMHISEASVRDMASNGKISFAEFAAAMDNAFGAHSQEANKTFTGALANMKAALARLGAAFASPQLTRQRDIFNALTPVIDNLKKTLMPLIDTFNFLFTLSSIKLVNAINKIDLGPLAFSIPGLSKGIIHLFEAFNALKGVVVGAFKDIFPPINGAVIFIKIAHAFEVFTQHLVLAGKAAKFVKDIFRIVFSALSIGWEIVKVGAQVIFGLAQAMSNVTKSPFLSFVDKVAKFFVNLQKVLVKDQGIQKFFDNFSLSLSGLKGPIDILKKIGEFIGKLFTGFDVNAGDKVASSLGRVGDRVKNIEGLFSRIGNFLAPFFDALGRVKDVLDEIWTVISNWFKELGQKLAAVISKGEFNNLLDALNVVLVGGIAAILARFLKTGSLFKSFLSIDPKGGFFDKVKLSLDQLTSTLKTMQANIKANALLKIAGAIAILTASVLVLSLIDSAALTKALTAMAVGFGQLMAAFAVLNQMNSTPKAALNFTLIAGGLILLSGAILILAFAAKVLGTMDWNAIGKGLTGVTSLLVLMVGVSHLLSDNVGNMVIASGAIVVMASALVILGAAMKIFGSMSWDEIGRGLTAMGGGLALIAAAMNLMPVNLPVTGAGLILVATGLTILGAAMVIFGSLQWSEIGKGLVVIAGGLILIAAGMSLMPLSLPITGAGLILVASGLTILGGAMKIFGSMDWAQIAKGLVTVGGALVIIALAMQLMPLTLPLTAAGLILVAEALVVIGAAMKIFGSMSWSEVGKGLTVLGGSLLILALATNAMTGAIAGAAALVVVAAALTLLVPVVVALSKLSWGDLLHGLVALAAVMAVLGLSALVLAPIIPALIGLGVALALIGGGFALFGAGVILVSKGIEGIAKSGKAAAGAIGEVLAAMAKTLGAFGKGIAQAIVDMAVTLAKGAPVLVKALAVILEHIIDTLIKLIPKFIKVVELLIDGLLQVFKDKTPDIISAGFEFLINFLKGIRDNISEITKLVGEIIVRFLDALSEEVPRIVDSITNLLTEIMKSVARNLGEVMATLGPELAKAFFEGMLQGLNAEFGGVLQWFAELPGKILDLVKSLFGINSPSTEFMSIGKDIILGLLNGLINTIGLVLNWFKELPGKIIKSIGDASRWLLGVGADIIRGIANGFLTGWHFVSDWLSQLPSIIIDVINNAATKPLDMLTSIGGDIIEGLANGIRAGAHWLKDAWNAIMDQIPLGLGKRFEIHSPSKLMAWYGGMITLGLAVGINNNVKEVEKSMTNLSDVVTEAFNPDAAAIKASFDAIVAQLGDLDNMNPTITPVLDLTQFAKDASKIGDYISAQNVAPKVSFATANSIATTQTPTEATTGTTPTSGDVKFEQNIYAPKQLSTADIYKNTRNQITLAKEELKI